MSLCRSCWQRFCSLQIWWSLYVRPIQLNFQTLGHAFKQRVDWQSSWKMCDDIQLLAYVRMKLYKGFQKPRSKMLCINHIHLQGILGPSIHQMGRVIWSQTRLMWSALPLDPTAVGQRLHVNKALKRFFPSVNVYGLCLGPASLFQYKFLASALWT